MLRVAVTLLLFCLSRFANLVISLCEEFWNTKDKDFF